MQRPNYLIIWIWLMALALLSVIVSLVVSEGAAVVLIFAIAIAKAILVGLNYMHLKSEKPLIYALVLVPLLVIVVLLIALFPDFVLGE